MKIIGKNKPAAAALDKAAEIQAAILAQADGKDVEFDTIRAAIPDGDKIPDGTIHQIAIDNGYEVEID